LALAEGQELSLQHSAGLAGFKAAK